MSGGVTDQRAQLIRAAADFALMALTERCGWLPTPGRSATIAALGGFAMYSELLAFADDQMPPVAQRRTCLLCGRAFSIIIPRDAPEKDQVKLCGDCASLPEPPDEPTIGGEDEQPDDSSDGEDYSGV